MFIRFSVLLGFIFSFYSFGIVNGMKTPQNQYNWSVWIQINGEWSNIPEECGGQIIERHWILTAAHCFNDTDIRNFNNEDNYIKIGLRDSNNDWYEINSKDFGEEVEVIVHPHYNNSNPFDFNDDIALIRLNKPIESVDPIELITAGNQFDILVEDRAGIIASWGGTENPSDVDLALRHGSIEGLHEVFIAGIPTELISSDFSSTHASGADSGGAIVVQDGSGKDFLAGVIVSSVPMTVPPFHGESTVGVDVYKKLDWIRDTISSRVVFKSGWNYFSTPRSVEEIEYSNGNGSGLFFYEYIEGKWGDSTINAGTSSITPLRGFIVYNTGPSVTVSLTFEPIHNAQSVYYEKWFGVGWNSIGVTNSNQFFAPVSEGNIGSVIDYSNGFENFGSSEALSLKTKLNNAYFIFVTNPFLLQSCYEGYSLQGSTCVKN